MQRLTQSTHIQAAQQKITALLSTCVEWFLIVDGGRSEALKNREIEFRVAHNKLFLLCWTECGTMSWHIRAWSCFGERLVFQSSRNMGRDTPILELTPRAPATTVAATIRAARQARAERLAELITSQFLDLKLERVTLSPGMKRDQPGRYARIMLRTRHQRVAVTASVASHLGSDADNFIAAALLWLCRVGERIRPPYIEQLWLILEDELIKAVLPRLALLKTSLVQILQPFMIDCDWSELKPLQIPQRRDLWSRRLARFPPHLDQPRSKAAEMIVGEAPEAIDVVRAKQGETLRYFGLPFARVRKLMNVERVWFGLASSSRCLLEPRTMNEWQRLIADLREHRCARAPDHRHALFRDAAEAWLESLLRRDISKLDPGLIIAPLYAQFRLASSGRLGVRPIDLLALRHDGRLVVIELKVTENREHVLQGVSYWQRVEAHRRKGNITRAQLFGDRVIRNQPPLVYLVTPTLRVHRAFTTLAHFVAPDIEIYRFDINEDWRSGVRVMRRVRAN